MFIKKPITEEEAKTPSRLAKWVSDNDRYFFKIDYITTPSADPDLRAFGIVDVEEKENKDFYLEDADPNNKGKETKYFKFGNCRICGGEIKPYTDKYYMRIYDNGTWSCELHCADNFYCKECAKERCSYIWEETSNPVAFGWCVDSRVRVGGAGIDADDKEIVTYNNGVTETNSYNENDWYIDRPKKTENIKE